MSQRYFIVRSVVRFLIVMSFTSSLLIGCAKAQRSMPQEVSPEIEPAKAIQLRIIPAGHDSAYPDSEINPADSTTMDQVLYRGNEVEFKKVISLPDPENPRDRPLFLVWHEDVLGSPIREAHYEYRIESVYNEKRRAATREPVSFDPETRRWFIPFESLFGRREFDVDPSEKQHLRLDLLLADHSRVELQVRFRALGPVPPIEHLGSRGLVNNLGKLTSTEMFQNARSELVLHEESLSNPTRRTLHYWVKAVQTGPFHLTSNLEVTRYYLDGKPSCSLLVDTYTCFADVDPVYRRTENGHLEAQMRVGLKIGEGVKKEQFASSSGQWVSIKIPALATMRLQWIAEPDGAPVDLPPPVQRQLVWTVAIWKDFFSPVVPENRSYSAAETWSVTSTQFEGGFSRDIRVGVEEPDFATPRRFDFARTREIASDSFTFAAQGS